MNFLLNNKDTNSFCTIYAKDINGEIWCSGAKNFACKAIIASLLSRELVTISNVPNIDDVQITLQMLEKIGLNYEFKDNILRIYPFEILKAKIEIERSNRMPLLIISALMHFVNQITVPHVTGCTTFGKRNIEFFENVFKQFGIKVMINKLEYTASRNTELIGTNIKLDYPSIGVTEAALLLAVLAEGTSIISNIAIEPEICELINLLNKMGAMIKWIGKRKVLVQGVQKLYAVDFSIIFDRVEAVSWACLAAATNGSITVHNVCQKNLHTFIEIFKKIGGGVQIIDSNTIRFFRESTNLQPIKLETDVYPAFSTDYQPMFGICLTQANGVSTIHETVFENRLLYLKHLAQYGLKVKFDVSCHSKLCRYNLKYDHIAHIYGACTYKNIEALTPQNIRESFAYIIVAALSNNAVQINNLHHINRGYENIYEKLRCVGVNVKMASEPA